MLACLIGDWGEGWERVCPSMSLLVLLFSMVRIYLVTPSRDKHHLVENADLTPPHFRAIRTCIFTGFSGDGCAHLNSVSGGLLAGRHELFL